MRKEMLMLVTLVLLASPIWGAAPTTKPATTGPATRPATTQIGKVHSDVLAKEPERAIDETVGWYAKTGPKVDRSSAMAQMRQHCPGLLEVGADQETRWQAGKFDDKAAAERVKRDRQILQDYGYEFPAASRYLLTEFRDGKLAGARLSLLSHLLECHVEHLKGFIRNPK